jgi:hypothetical protein
MYPTFVWVMPYLAASLRWLHSPVAYSARISTTSSSVNFDRCCSSPRGTLVRPRSQRSRTLSALVPSLRCLGFTQGGLSQVCKTCSPAGTLIPLANSHATTCALRVVLGGEKYIDPYPSSVRAPIHSQHSSGPANSVLEPILTLRGIIVVMVTHGLTPANLAYPNLSSVRPRSESAREPFGAGWKTFRPSS